MTDAQTQAITEAAISLGEQALAVKITGAYRYHGYQRDMEKDEAEYLLRELKFRYLISQLENPGNLIANAWNWDLTDFAERTGLNPDDASTQRQFLALQEAARALGNLSPEVLSAVCAPADEKKK